MIPKLQLTEISKKTEELCLVILNEPSFKGLREMVDDFLATDDAIEQYNRFMDKQENYQKRLYGGYPVSIKEQDELEQEKRELYNYSITRNFIYAQQEFKKIQTLVNQYIAKTIELERVPSEEDLEMGGCSCGGSCGCGGH